MRGGVCVLSVIPHSARLALGQDQHRALGTEMRGCTASSRPRQLALHLLTACLTQAGPSSLPQS